MTPPAPQRTRPFILLTQMMIPRSRHRLSDLEADLVATVADRVSPDSALVATVTEAEWQVLADVHETVRCADDSMRIG